MLSPRVVIVVEGGVVQNVLTDSAVCVMVKDFDNIQGGDEVDPDSFDFPTGYFPDIPGMEAEILADVHEGSLNAGYIAKRDKAIKSRKQPDPEKRLFRIGLTYFKDTGKFYTSAEFQDEFRFHPQDGNTVYLPDVVAKVRGWRDQGGQGSLPGLAGEGWDGFILVAGGGVLTHLITPREV